MAEYSFETETFNEMCDSLGIISTGEKNDLFEAFKRNNFPYIIGKYYKFIINTLNKYLELSINNENYFNHISNSDLLYQCYKICCDHGLRPIIKKNELEKFPILNQDDLTNYKNRSKFNLGILDIKDYYEFESESTENIQLKDKYKLKCVGLCIVNNGGILLRSIKKAEIIKFNYMEKNMMQNVSVVNNKKTENSEVKKMHIDIKKSLDKLNKYIEEMQSESDEIEIKNTMKIIKILMKNISVLEDLPEEYRNNIWLTKEPDMYVLLEHDGKEYIEESLKYFNKYSNLKEDFVLAWDYALNKLNENKIHRLQIDLNKYIVTDSDLNAGWEIKDRKETENANEDLLVYEVLRYGIVANDTLIRPPVVNVFYYDQRK